MAPWGIVVREIGQFLPKLNAINQSENVERLNVSIEFSTRTGDHCVFYYFIEKKFL